MNKFSERRLGILAYDRMTGIPDGNEAYFHIAQVQKFVLPPYHNYGLWEIKSASWCGL